MNIKILEKLQKDVDKQVIDAECLEKNFVITFKEKSLLVSKKKSYKFIAREDMSNICLKCISDSIMSQVSFYGIRIHFTFEKAGQPIYKLSFKSFEILE